LFRAPTLVAIDYNPIVSSPAESADPVVHDTTLIDWFLSLTPGERLAELESRLTFFNSVRRDDDAELSPHTRAP
jgi:hypothetical protein